MLLCKEGQLINDCNDENFLILGLKRKTASYFMNILRNQYKIYRIRKKDRRSFRVIEDPPAALKRYQRLVNDMLADYELPSCVVGFRKNKRIPEFLERHKGAKQLITLDIHDFFGSTTEKFTRVLFMGQPGHPLHDEHVKFQAHLNAIQKKTYGNELADRDMETLMYICCKNDYYKDHYLPQGSPASPTLSNIIFSPVDKQIVEKIKKDGLKMEYSRYADDLIFTLDTPIERDKTDKFIADIKKMITDYGYEVNPKKVHVMRSPGQLRSMGLIINQRVAPARWERKRMRAIMHNVLTNGFSHEAVKYGSYSSNAFYRTILGKLSWWCQVEPERFSPLRTQWKALWAAEHDGLDEEELAEIILETKTKFHQAREDAYAC